MRVTVTPEQVATAFDTVKDDPSFDESRQLFEQGRLPVEMIQAMSLRPEILRAFAAFGDGVYPGGLLERALKERVILEASRANECQFCRDSHIALIRMLDIAEDPIASLDCREELPGRQRLALAYTRAAMNDSNRIPDDMLEELKEHFTDPELVELTFLIGFINMLNMFNNCLQVTYRNEYEVLED